MHVKVTCKSFCNILVILTWKFENAFFHQKSPVGIELLFESSWYVWCDCHCFQWCISSSNPDVRKKKCLKITSAALQPVQQHMVRITTNRKTTCYYHVLCSMVLNQSQPKWPVGKGNVYNLNRYHMYAYPKYIICIPVQLAKPMQFTWIMMACTSFSLWLMTNLQKICCNMLICSTQRNTYPPLNRQNWKRLEQVIPLQMVDVPLRYYFTKLQLLSVSSRNQYVCSPLYVWLVVNLEKKHLRYPPGN